MADDRQALLDKLAELDQKELGNEHARLVSRLYEIRAEAAKMIVAYRETGIDDLDAAFLKAAGLAEEASQHGVKLAELRNA